MLRRRFGAVSAAAFVALAMAAAPASAAAYASVHVGVARDETSSSATGGHAEALVADMTTAEQAASVVMGHIPTTDAAALHAYMQQGLGGFILMGANIPATDDELQTLTDALTVDPALPPLVAIDQEGGIVSRLGGDGFPASTVLKSQPASDTSAAFSARAALVAKAGITVNFGTVADVTSDPSSFIYGRALGTDPQTAAERVDAATAAQEQVIASTLKHFPGHGAAPGDSHSAIPATAETIDDWRATDAVPFAAGIEAGASLLMFGHLAYTSIDPAPASLSARWHEIAREQLGFDGVIVTDDLGMLQSSGIPDYADPVKNAVSAVVAGSDLVLMIAGSTPDTAGQIIRGLAEAVDAGVLPADRLADAAARVMSLRLESASATKNWALCPECEPAD